MISKRNLLRGLFAAPAIIAIDRLMPIKSFIIPPSNTYLDQITALMNDAMSYNLFEPNDVISRRCVTGIIENSLSNMQKATIIDNYRVVCDDSNNTDIHIVDGIIGCSVYVSPTKATNYIKMDGFVSRKGLTFNDQIGIV